MTPKQVEKLAAAAWAVANAGHGACPVINRISLGEELRTVLVEIDPGRTYDPYTPTSALLDANEKSLRDSPTLKTAAAAGTHE
jgi:hypothetical protein